MHRFMRARFGFMMRETGQMLEQLLALLAYCDAHIRVHRNTQCGQPRQVSAAISESQVEVIAYRKYLVTVSGLFCC